ncbi:LacI family DNA-binding transcriptional regulator [Winkia sp. UMB3158]|uniref:LacI family DNA-binding transcriptional regulator n=1 Tax=unclassified Winkia TaxID=2692119 RepID=UPI0025569B66|nr:MULTISPECIES: LacI family DNA-binding transcriptional regulator [unclassified Winkia]MDK7150517.1 LacI family DNA-binding transcriptional regulator [Winkia sp. UMB3158]MDK7906652.1 LacI family DNA-binding transcriptional regulator [Winkia sp. UMB0889B]MDK8342159.1 LacI family DNA-binding transcriptional regulator [Winkia sp. UMB3164B]MDK8566093.1 LacI family DNA-binding transcriptional regulator [Winkia sp. UMB3164A]
MTEPNKRGLDSILGRNKAPLPHGRTTGRGARKAVTINDVAQEAGVAPSTVSRTFSRPGRVNAETAERVREAARKLGYRTGPVSRAVSTPINKMLAIVVNDISNPLLGDTVRGFQARASKLGYMVMLVDSLEDGPKERAGVERVLSTADGIALTSSRMSDSAIRQIIKVKPVVTINRAVSSIPSIVTDTRAGMKYAVSHLTRLGHKRITYLAGPEESWADGVRWRSLLKAGEQAGIRVRRTSPQSGSVEGGYAAGKEFLHAKTTAVIAYNDLMAAGFVRFLRENGIQVPHEVSVIGIGNTMAATLSFPPLTTVATPAYTMGVTGASMLIGQIRKHGVAQVPAMVLPMKLIERASTAQV